MTKKTAGKILERSPQLTVAGTTSKATGKRVDTPWSKKKKGTGSKRLKRERKKGADAAEKDPSACSKESGNNTR